MTMNGAVLPIMAFYTSCPTARRKPKDLAGTIQNDILKEFMVRNTYIYPPQQFYAYHFGYFQYTSEGTCPNSTASVYRVITCKRLVLRQI